MSNPLKVGDRVRVVGIEHIKPANEKGARILRGEVDGEILHMQPAWSTVKFEGTNYHVSTKNLQRVSPRRTFLEIINALIADLNKLTEENDYGLLKITTAGTAVIWYEPIPGEITYYDITQEGEFGTDKDYTFTPAGHLAAIAAACTEIAANYEAEHGKEEQKNG